MELERNDLLILSVRIVAYSSILLYLPHQKGIVAERLGSALQKLLQRFESAQYLGQEAAHLSSFFILYATVQKLRKSRPKRLEIRSIPRTRSCSLEQLFYFIRNGAKAAKI